MRANIILLVLAAVLAWPQPVHATTVAVLSDAQMVEFADSIALVTITATESFRFADRIILTRVHARVHETYKGDVGDETACYVRGGRADGLVQTVEGEYMPTKGERLVVFLESIPRYGDVPMLLGLSQGAFVLENVPMTRSDRRSPVAVHRGHFAPCLPGSEICSASTLDELRRAIRSRIDAPKGG